jgi:hypothetical protein
MVTEQGVGKALTTTVVRWKEFEMIDRWPQVKDPN